MRSVCICEDSDTANKEVKKFLFPFPFSFLISDTLWAVCLFAIFLFSTLVYEVCLDTWYILNSTLLRSVEILLLPAFFCQMLCCMISIIVGYDRYNMVL